MTSLSNLLSFGPGGGSALPPSSAYIAVTDTLASSGAFVAVNLARTLLLTAAKVRDAETRITTSTSTTTQAPSTIPVVIWLGCEGSGESHWRTLLRKAVSIRNVAKEFQAWDKNDAKHSSAMQGVNANAQQGLHFIDAASIVLGSKDSSGLKLILEAVKVALAQNPGQPATTVPSNAGVAVIIDDLTALSWILAPGSGDPAFQLSRWLRAIRLLLEQKHGALCTIQHSSATDVYSDSTAHDTVDDALLRLVLTTAEPDVWVEIRGLRSGRAKDCDGELVIRPLLRPQLASLPGAGESLDDAQDHVVSSAFSLPNVSIPPRPLLFRLGPDPTSRISETMASSYGGSQRVDDWRGVQLWPRGMMRGFLNMLPVSLDTERPISGRPSTSRHSSPDAPSYDSNVWHGSLVSLEARPVELVEASEVRVDASIVPEQDPGTDSGASVSSDLNSALPCYQQVLSFKRQKRLRLASELDPQAGTLGLTVNGSVLRQASDQSSVRPTVTATAATARESSIEPPSALAIAFLGHKRAYDRARRRAERRTARLEEIHNAWARLGVNTRELLARGGKSALPPYFKSPPRCTWEEMMAQV
ncbi:hypothetical protein OC861_000027 [Tilletia horrida]|nr:hypothetical protein OC861_000027 [Tilletia horrida]